MSGARMNRKRDSTPSKAALARRPALILLALLAILAVNVGAAFAPLAGFQFAVNLVLAGAGVALIGLFFMDLDRETPLNRLFAAAGIAWLAIFLLLIFSDYATRI